MPRRRMQQTFKLAETVGCYDEYPTMPDGVDPQLMISRNDRPQPFHLVCEKDTILVQMTGRATVEFKGSSVNYFRASPGDYVYVPAGTPHTIRPDGPCIQYRYKAEAAGLEAVAWYCAPCGAEVARITWDTASELPQEGYLRATAAFNDDPSMRRCKKCGAEHPKVDVTGNNWAAVANELRAGQADDDDW